MPKPFFFPSVGAGIRVALVIAFVTAISLAVPMVVARTWKSSDGVYSLDAEFVEAADGTASLRKPNGEVIRLPIAQLCAEDQAYIAQQTAAADSPESSRTTDSQSAGTRTFSQLARSARELHSGGQDFNVDCELTAVEVWVGRIFCK